MGLRSYGSDVVTSTSMVMMEGCVVGLTIMTKTSMARGMSSFVFVLYSNALTSLILLPFFFFHRPNQSCFTFSFLSKSFFLSLIGITVAQNCAFAGLSYSSPIVVCSMSSLIPALSFLLAIFSRREKLHLRSSSSKAKSIGTLISIMGAIEVTLCKGPPIKNPTPVPPSYQLQHSSQQLLLYASTPENWVLGAILLALSSLCVSIWNFVQTGTSKEYPQVMNVITFYSLFGTIQCAIVTLIAERNPNAWILQNKMEFINIALSAVFGSVLRSSIHAWCICHKGHVYVGMFKPLSIFFAVILGGTFFGDSLHIGSVIGAFVIAAGYHGVMWGLVKEEEMSEEDDRDDSSEESYKVPLLEEDSQV